MLPFLFPESCFWNLVLKSCMVMSLVTLFALDTYRLCIATGQEKLPFHLTPPKHGILRHVVELDELYHAVGCVIATDGEKPRSIV
jgi:hypothetical protein